MGDLVLLELTRRYLLLKHEIKSADALVRWPRKLRQNSLVGSPATGLGKEIPSCSRGEYTHTTEHPADFTLQIPFIGVYHVRVDNLDDETEELITDIGPCDDTGSKAGRTDFRCIDVCDRTPAPGSGRNIYGGTGNDSQTELEAGHVEHSKARHSPSRR